MINLQDLFDTLRKINSNPDISQRSLAKQLGFSLGKLNYCIQELNKKGFIKINNFRKRKNKIKYFKKYLLTAKGIQYRIQLTTKFMEKKMKEYDKLKKEINTSK